MAVNSLRCGPIAEVTDCIFFMRALLIRAKVPYVCTKIDTLEFNVRVAQELAAGLESYVTRSGEEWSLLLTHLGFFVLACESFVH